MHEYYNKLNAYHTEQLHVHIEKHALLNQRNANIINTKMHWPNGLFDPLLSHWFDSFFADLISTTMCLWNVNFRSIEVFISLTPLDLCEQLVTIGDGREATPEDGRSTVPKCLLTPVPHREAVSEGDLDWKTSRRACVWHAKYLGNDSIISRVGLPKKVLPNMAKGGGWVERERRHAEDDQYKATEWIEIMVHQITINVRVGIVPRDAHW